MGDNLTFVHNIVDNSGATGTSIMYFAVNPAVLHPNINAEGANGSMDNFELANNFLIGGEVTVAGGVGIQHSFTPSGSVDGFPTYTTVWDPESDLVLGAMRTITNNVFIPETGETQATGIFLVGYIPTTIPTGPVTITDNSFNAGIDDPIAILGGQNADNPSTPIIDLAEAFDTNTFAKSVLVTVDEERTQVRAEEQQSRSLQSSRAFMMVLTAPRPMILSGSVQELMAVAQQ
jgi:hypothetical protein